MYACMYVYTYVCIYTYVFAYVYICKHTHTHTHYVYIYTVDLSLDVHYADVLPALLPYCHTLAVGEDIVYMIHFAVARWSCSVTVDGSLKSQNPRVFTMLDSLHNSTFFFLAYWV